MDLVNLAEQYEATASGLHRRIFQLQLQLQRGQASPEQGQANLSRRIALLWQELHEVQQIMWHLRRYNDGHSSNIFRPT